MTLNIVRQTEHWWNSALDEIEFVQFAATWRRTRHALFHAHLAVELALKAAVCKATEDVPPKIHDLVRLADMTNLTISSQHKSFLAQLNLFNITGRYTDPKPAEPNHEEADKILHQSVEFIEWLKSQLFKA